MEPQALQINVNEVANIIDVVVFGVKRFVKKVVKSFVMGVVPFFDESLRSNRRATPVRGPDVKAVNPHSQRDYSFI